MGPYVETHVRIMTYPNVGMAISSDLGPGVHPTNKSGYGRRAAAVALGMTYGKPIEYYGPVYASHAVEGNKIRVKFTHVGKGLALRHSEKLQGFAIAGDDGKFHWGDAQIDGDTVVVTSASVPKPAHVPLRLVRQADLGQPVQSGRPAGGDVPDGWREGKVGSKGNESRVRKCNSRHSTMKVTFQSVCIGPH